MLVRFVGTDDTVAILFHHQQTPYKGGLFNPPLTPTLSRPEPEFDPLRDGPGFPQPLPGIAK